MPFPNLFILGAPKCGTTSLAAWLGQHPQVYMSPVKEPHYFSSDFAISEIRQEAQYLALFEQAQSQHRVIGEASVWYLRSEVAVPSIQNKVAQPRYVVMLRNPITMAPSLHLQTLVSGDEEEEDFATAWQLQDRRRQDPSTLPRFCRVPAMLDYEQGCRLGDQLGRLLQHVPRQQVQIIFLEDLAHQRARVWDELCGFLDIDPQAPIQFDVVNRARRWRWPLVQAMELRYHNLRRRLRIPPLSFGLYRKVRTLALSDYDYPALAQPMRQQLRDAFAEDIALLAELTARNLDHWLEIDTS